MDKNFLTGVEWFKKGELHLAEQSLKKCLNNNNNHFDALHLLAIIYFQSAKIELSLKFFQCAFSIKDDALELNLNYTNALIKLRMANKCLYLLEFILIKFPNNPKLLSNQAMALTMIKDFSLASQVFAKLYTITNKPKYSIEQAKCEGSLKNWSLALNIVKSIIEQFPSEQFAYDYQIICLFELRKHTDLINFFIVHNENLSEKHKEITREKVHKSLNYLDKDIVSKLYKAVYTIDPYGPKEMIELHVASKHPPIFNSLKDITTYRDNYILSLDNIKKINNEELLDGFRPKSHFYLAFHGENNKYINTKLSSIYPIKHNKKLSFSSSVKKKLLVVSDRLIDGHTISKLNLGLLTHLSEKTFEVIVIIPSRNSTIALKNIKDSIEKVEIVTEDLISLISRIETIKPDFIYYPEIGMSGLIYSLAHHRLAPIQFTSWGHPETTGINNIDYFISSEHIEPIDCEQHYSECLVKLSKLPTIYSQAKIAKKLSKNLEKFKTNDKYITCLQSTFKFHPEFDEIIKEILIQNPTVKLYILASECSELLLNRFKEFRINLEQIVVLPHMENDDFLYFYSQSTVALDPIHFGGGNTVYEAMSFNVPVVTLPGEFMRGRVTSGAYNQMGLASLIVDSKAAYISLVNQLIQDESFHTQIKNEIESKKDAIFDTTEVANELENKLLGLIENVK